MSTEVEILEKLKKLLVEVTDNESLQDTLIGATDIINDVGLDSIQMINFVLMIEDEFGIQIDFENFDVENLSSIETLSKYVSNLIVEVSACN